MNNDDLAAIRTKHYRKYHKMGGNALNCRCKVNKIIKWKNAKKEHEDAKEIVCHILLSHGKKFICEAVENRSPLRRDIVCLDDNIAYEIETDPKRAARFDGQPNVRVIKLWKDEPIGTQMWRYLNNG